MHSQHVDKEEVANEILNPERAAKSGFPHDLYTQLRAEPTLTWLEPDDIDPFWAISKHADVKEISTQPDKFLNEPRPFVQSREMEQWVNQNPIRTLLNMDPPQHRDYRNIVRPWFVPRNIRKLEERMRRSAEQLVGMMASSDTWEGDFVFDVAAIHPVRLITHLFGLPDSDEKFLIELANTTFGSDDPEFRKAEDGLQSLMLLIRDAIEYFGKLAQSRRENPTDDLATVIANAEINGEPISPLFQFGYYIVILTAGHETTRTAMSGGMLALIQNPEELRKLKQDPTLAESAIEEMVRWTSPVSQFGRTAVEDYELRGQTIKAGQSVCLFYGSANRDEEVFEDPFSFRVDRRPNPHLGFGVGEHFCLGAALARLEMKVFLEELIPRLDAESLELTGDVEYLASNFVGGVKHLPMRCKVSQA